jgi:putative flavoprotein involved in K+ transport
MTDADVLIVGAGHGGLASAYQFMRRKREVLVIDEAERIGDSWRHRYDSLRLFTPVPLVELPGLSMARDVDTFPTKDQVADYQERYARSLGVRIHLGRRVTAARPDGTGIVVETTGGTFIARELVVATGVFQTPKVPAFAAQLDPDVFQIHTSEYRRPSQIPSGTVVVVGSGNSGGDIAAELSRERPVLLSEGTRRKPPPPWWRSVWAWRIAWLRDRVTNGGEISPHLVWPLRVGRFYSADYVRAVRRGAVRVVSRTIGASGSGLTLVDGGRLRVDAVIWATGYSAERPWLHAAPDDPRVHVLTAKFLFSLEREAGIVARRSAGSAHGHMST